MSTSSIDDEFSTRVEFDRSKIASCLPGLSIFARQQSRLYDSANSSDRRSSPRHLAIIPVIVIPVGTDRTRIGQPFEALTRDISLSGLSLYHGRAELSRLLVVDFGEDANIQVTLEVAHSRIVGSYHVTGGRLISGLLPVELDRLCRLGTNVA